MSYSRILVTVFLLACLASFASGAPGQAPRTGGTIHYAMFGEPATLDPMWTTNFFTRRIAAHMFESLFTYTERYEVIPMLAESHVVSDSARRYEIKVRRGVRFHNGTVMTASDVVASLQRWFEVTGRGRASASILNSLSATDTNTVLVTFKEPNGLFLPALANLSQLAAIMPKAIVDRAPRSQLPPEQLVGTGPYMLDEWRHDHYVRLKRFENYSARTDAARGYGGAKRAYLEQIVFFPVPDATVRLAGTEKGQYHFAEQISGDEIDTIKKSRQLIPIISKSAPLYPAVVFNKHKPPTNRVKFRQAVAAALDMEPLLKAQVKRPEFYALNGSIYSKASRWHTTAGLDRYNVHDLSLVSRLLAESGYKGEALTLLAQTDLEAAFQYVLVAIQQLRTAGFKVSPIYTDNPTIVSLRGKVDAFDMWFAHGFSYQDDPSDLIGFDCNWPAIGMGWCEDDAQRLVKQLRAEPEFPRRYRIWSDLHRLYWERVPFVKIGDIYVLNVIRNEVKGFQNLALDFFWNVWLER